MRSNAAGRPAALPLRGSSLRMALMVSTAESRWKGRRPVSISARMAPAEKRSDRWSALFPRTCSGDM